MTEEVTQAITADDIHEAKTAHVHLIIEGLEGIGDLIDEMKSAKLGVHTLWLGGLPTSVANINQQTSFLAEQVREAFGLAEPT